MTLRGSSLTFSARFTLRFAMYAKTMISALPREQWRAIRYLLHQSQDEWGKLLGASARMVKAWEHGQAQIPLMADRVLTCICQDERIRAALLTEPDVYLALTEKGFI